ncbi:hypothetical protein BD770DRAFT_397985 [Pilaira anomala]|nr:hypothetical protein BD770DRAFT_397985 [Pilaira anomala]
MTEVIDVDLLVEAGEAELFESYKMYLNNNHIKDWKVLKIFQHTIQKFYSDDFTQAVGSFKNSFKKFLNDYNSPDKRQKLAVENMRNNVGAVLASKPAQVAFEKGKRSELEKLYGAHVKNSVYQDKITFIDSTNIENNAGPSTSKSQPVPSNNKRAISKPNTRSKKKTKRIEVRDIKHLPFDQKIHTLVNNFCSNNILNLASPGLIPERFKVEINKIKKRLQIVLPLAVNEQERQLLIRLSNTKSLEDIEALAKSIPLVPQTGNFIFLSIALTKLVALWQSEVLLNHDHKEAWLQMQLYGDLLDSAFLFDKNYSIKRSECHASTIKYLKKMKKIDGTEKDCRVDLILFNHGYGDMFTCEDKCESAMPGAVQNDIEKGNKLREKRLLYLKSIIPYKSNINHIEVLSAQFHGLTLTIYGSKMTESGDIIHYQKANASIPTSPFNHLPQAAHYLLTVLSLQRNIAINLKKLEIIFETCLKDTVEYLTAPIGVTSSNLFFREDSPGSECSWCESNTSDELELEEQERRIMECIDQQIKNLDNNDEGFLTANDWESFIAE